MSAGVAALLLLLFTWCQSPTLAFVTSMYTAASWASAAAEAALTTSGWPWSTWEGNISQECVQSVPDSSSDDAMQPLSAPGKHTHKHVWWPLGMLLHFRCFDCAVGHAVHANRACGLPKTTNYQLSPTCVCWLGSTDSSFSNSTR